MFEVIVNGDVKGTIHVPGSDPSYVVTVNEVASSIQLRHLNGSRAIVQSIKAVLSEEVYPAPVVLPSPGIIVPIAPPFHHFPTNQAATLSRRAITLVDILENFANYTEYGQYLLPIKKVAGRSYAVSVAYGDLSLHTREALLALRQQLVFAYTYLSSTFERDAAFETAVELMSLTEKLDAVLK